MSKDPFYYENRPMGDPIEVEITANDIKDAVYDNLFDCPLARACKRVFQMPNIRVSGLFVIMEASPNYQFLIDDPNGFMEEDYNAMLLNFNSNPEYTHKIKLQQYIPIAK
jgi:hypothetical protein